ncbi:MAG: hypothetical protein GF411_10000 [Candidatus Lokiarchaeota archaeon]|nr:hypothetical protein [Candidatus Lokiarchaeota archaeon]
MGFLSGKKKVDSERGILEIKGTMNALTLRIRRLDTRMAEERKSAKDAMKRGDRSSAKAHLTHVMDLEGRKSRYRQQVTTLETALMNLEEAQDQAEVLSAFKIANAALAQARELLSPTEIQMQLDRLSQSFEHISIAGELLSEDLSSGATTLEAEERIDRELDAIEAEVLLEKEGVLPPLEDEREAEAVTSADSGSSKEERIDAMLADLEREAREEREKEAQS